MKLGIALLSTEKFILFYISLMLRYKELDIITDSNVEQNVDQQTGTFGILLILEKDRQKYKSIGDYLYDDDKWFLTASKNINDNLVNLDVIAISVKIIDKIEYHNRGNDINNHSDITNDNHINNKHNTNENHSIGRKSNTGNDKVWWSCCQW